MYLFLSEVLNLQPDLAKLEADKIKQSMSDETLNELIKYVHKVLGLNNLNCAYNINNESCRTCVKRERTRKELLWKTNY